MLMLQMPAPPPRAEEYTLVVKSAHGLEHEITTTATTVPELEQQVRSSLHMATPVSLLVHDKDFGEFVQGSLAEIRGGDAHIFTATSTAAEERKQRLLEGSAPLAGGSGSPSESGESPNELFALPTAQQGRCG